MVSGLGEEVHKLWVEVGGKGEIAATVTSHYYIGEDMVGHALRQFMDKHPPWVSMAAWASGMNYQDFCFCMYSFYYGKPSTTTKSVKLGREKKGVAGVACSVILIQCIVEK